MVVVMSRDVVGSHVIVVGSKEVVFGSKVVV